MKRKQTGLSLNDVSILLLSLSLLLGSFLKIHEHTNSAKPAKDKKISQR
jgi:hypothetical protein